MRGAEVELLSQRYLISTFDINLTAVGRRVSRPHLSFDAIAFGPFVSCLRFAHSHYIS
jgi:hypothetical protein